MNRATRTRRRVQRQTSWLPLAIRSGAVWLRRFDHPGRILFVSPLPGSVRTRLSQSAEHGAKAHSEARL